MKKLIFLVILVIVLISKEVEAISTELFASPTAKTLKNGECLIGCRLFAIILNIIYMRIGILDFLETEGLISLCNIYGSLKLVLLKEKENLPQIAFMVNQGWSVEWWFEYSYTINSLGVVFSKKIQNWQINASIFKGKTPPIWVGGRAYYNENKKYSFHSSLERNLGNLKLIVELHNFPAKYNRCARENILIGGVMYKRKNFNFKLGHGFLKEKDEIEHIFPFLNIEYESRRTYESN